MDLLSVTSLWKLAAIVFGAGIVVRIAIRHLRQIPVKRLFGVVEVIGIVLGIVVGVIELAALVGYWRDTSEPAERNPAVSPEETRPAPAGYSGISLAQSSFLFPEDAVKLQNSALGPFCCTGHGIVVRTSEGDPVGYAYFFDWDGQARNVGNTHSIVPDQIVKISGASSLDTPNAGQIERRIKFVASSLTPASDWVRAGALEYRAILLDFDLDRHRDSAHFRMGSLKVRLDVRLWEAPVPSVLPAPSSGFNPPDGSFFDHYPRTLDLTWDPVPGAASYTVELDCLHCCKSQKWCTEVDGKWRGKTGLTQPNWSTRYVGAQPGRWRVITHDRNGLSSAPSTWINFTFTR